MKAQSMATFLVLALLLIIAAAPAQAGLAWKSQPITPPRGITGLAIKGEPVTPSRGTETINLQIVSDLLSGWAVWIWNPDGGRTGLAWKSHLRGSGLK